MANKKQTTNDESTVGQSMAGTARKTSTAEQSNVTGAGQTSNPFTAGQSASGGPVSGQSGSHQTGSGVTPSTSASTGAIGAGTAVARSFYDQAKETAGQAYDMAAEKATTKLEEQKTNLSGGLSSVAESVRMVGENLRGPDVQEGISKYTAEYSSKAAEKIESAANYFEQKSVREMYYDLENFARRNPLAFIGGAFALGLVTARFLRSGSPARNAAAGTAFATEKASFSDTGSLGGTSDRR
jgi:hypothetical protein